jgi:hypothetical protein
MKKLTLPILAAAFLAVLSPFALANPNPDDVRVYIYKNFDINNPPDASPYTGYMGFYDLPSDDFGIDIDFGQPFGLMTFAAVVQFTEFVSIEGFYKPSIDTENGTTANLFDWPNTGDINGPGPYSLGGVSEELGMNEGDTTFDIDFIADGPVLDGSNGIVGGPPYLLDIGFPAPYGGDPFTEDATVYIVPLPEVGSTMALLGGALVVLVLLRTFPRRPQSGKRLN